MGKIPWFGRPTCVVSLALSFWMVYWRRTKLDLGDGVLGEDSPDRLGQGGSLQVEEGPMCH